MTDNVPENVLPDVPSQLIRLALADLRACEADPKYVISMNEWYRRSGDICYVCMAGAVFAQTLGFSGNLNWVPGDDIERMTEEVRREISEKFSAIDDFRKGDITYGLSQMGYDAHESDDLDLDIPIYRDIPIYEENREAFHAAMLKLADYLEAAGL